MPWYGLALLAALFTASQATLLRRWFSDLSTAHMAAIPLVCGLPVFAVSLAATPVPDLQDGFWMVFWITQPVNAVGFALHMRAIRVSPLSLTMPYLALTPALVMLTGRAVLGEMPNAWGALGVLCIACGSYILHIEPGRGGGALAPLKAFAREPGSRCMLGAATIYALASVLGKKCVLLSSPQFFAMLFHTVFAAAGVLALALCCGLPLAALRRHPVAGLCSGLCFGAEALAHNMAIALAKAAYMIAIKRFSVVLSVLFGHLFLHERNLRSRLTGAALMFAGAAIIGLAGN
ncbi:drug/metabolite transporter (DMT)-like permease [Desulfobaculum xiamenense]|uniref:Drug/metabolite transporter (DMT)-like permease n=1 Tax=Desulfobaculum xiamenense TaxID=995050 RepID=A0A846QRN4_9BACT|nr:EamA family transporter [Desulfobaculum xiamenense]NJB67329.1 drug/metabolite transporter (DMT)-like permease [Desulfobaculum xiamenense]